MSTPTKRPPLQDADAGAVQRASRAVGLQITITSTVLVLAVLVAAFAFVFSHIKPANLFDPRHAHESTIDVGGVDILVAGTVIGLVAIALAGTMSWFATRRAVKPLGDALRVQRAFVADASHELRTPLSVLDARLQLLQRGLDTNDPSSPIVIELRRDAQTLIEIVNDLLATAEIGGPGGNTTPVAVNPVVSLAVESMRLIGADRDVTITIDDTAPLASLVPAASLNRCLVAMLDNALDFTPRGSTVHVSIGEVHSMVRIAVRDQGGGIVGINPGHIFDRFARAEHQADGPEHDGHGIGLALVRETVERYGGSASVASTSREGTEIEILVPKARIR